MSRGIERRDIVDDDHDRVRWLEWLERTIETYDWRVHAFVLMSNHQHVFVETPRANLSAGMQYLNGSYTSYFNRRHRRVGHLFQGRFKAQLIEEEGYFSELSRYIHLNPVRARMVDRPEQYAWSSYSGYHRADRVVPWLTYDRVLGEFTQDGKQARMAYRKFVRAGIKDPPKAPWTEAAHSVIVGSCGFVDRIRMLVQNRPTDPDIPGLQQLRQRPGLEEIVEAVAEAMAEDRSSWAAGRRNDSGGRALAAFVARRRYGYSAKQVAATLGYTSHTSVTRALERIEPLTPRLSRTVQRIEGQLDEHLNH